MIISRGRRYIFVHAPKTGGTSLALALEARAMADDILIGDTPKARRRRGRLHGLPARGRLWKHATLADIEGAVAPDDPARDLVVTLVRDPWARAVSYYHWLRSQRFDHPAVGLARDLDFADFLSHPQTLASFGAETYGSYVAGSDGREHPALFVRLEHLTADLRPFEAHLGFRLEVPHANAGTHPPYRDCYTPRSAELIGRIKAEDIRRFGYVF